MQQKRYYKMERDLTKKIELRHEGSEMQVDVSFFDDMGLVSGVSHYCYTDNVTIVEMADGIKIVKKKIDFFGLYTLEISRDYL